VKVTEVSKDSQSVKFSSEVVATKKGVVKTVANKNSKNTVKPAAEIKVAAITANASSHVD